MKNSNPTNQQLFPFQCRVGNFSNNNISEDSQITVYDGWDKIQCRGFGRIDTSLPSGLYTIRIERAGKLQEEVIRHKEKTEKSLCEPKRYSAAPLSDTLDTHEYYAGPGGEWSEKNTNGVIGIDRGNLSRIFIFIRAISRERYKGEDLAAGLSLSDCQGNTLTTFDKDVTKRDEKDGWLVFSAPIEPGTYVIRYKGKNPREMPVFIHKDWTTQLFLIFEGKPLFQSISVLMQHPGGRFDFNDRLTQVVDAALSGLQSGADFIHREAMNFLLDGKFENPMLGLLGAHLLLRCKEPDRNIIKQVLDNLEYLLSGSPDVQALRLIAAKRFNEPIPDQPFIYPPMIRAGLEAVLKYSTEMPDLVPEDSLIERIAPYVYSDSPWSNWQLQKPIANWTISSSFRKIDYGGMESLTVPAQVIPEWVIAFLKDAVEESRRKGKEIEIQKLAAQIGITVRFLENSLKSIQANDVVEINDQPMSNEGEGSPAAEY